MDLKKRIIGLAQTIVKRQKISVIVWLVIAFFGAFSYLSLLNREGFPPIQFPTGLVQGGYFVNDANLVDSQITQPISESLDNDELIATVQTTANENSFTVFATYDESLTNDQAAERFQDSIAKVNLPDEAQLNFIRIDPAAYLGEYPVLLSVYDESKTVLELQQDAQLISDALLLELDIEKAEVIEQLQTLTNPQTGGQEILETGFSIISFYEDEDLSNSKAVLVGIKPATGFDVIEFSDRVNEFVEENAQTVTDSEVTVAADFAPAIKQQISNLQSNVVTGLLVVVLVSFLLISWRASLITAVFISTVLLTTFLIMLIVGISINTISLFAIVLALGLFVDDATIVVEAIEANRKKKNHIEKALSKVATASIAGTLTTVLVFLPLVFVGGVLGEFIRILPLTLIIALIVSLILSLTLIPLLASLISTKTKSVSPLGKIETKIADGLADLIKRTRSKMGVLIGLAMITLSFVFIVGSFFFAGRLEFNIFPSAKDANELSVTINYLPNTDIAQAQTIARDVNAEIANIAESNISRIVYFQGNTRSATGVVELVDFNERNQTSVEIIAQLENFADNYDRASLRVAQIDGGPPSEQYPFKAQIYGDRDLAANLAEQISKRLQGSSIELPSGETTTVVDTNIGGVESVTRKSTEQFVEVGADFDSNQITAIVQQTRELIETEFGESAESNGLRLEFDFGQESENQESFNSLALIGPLSLLAMFILLGLQFKSVLLPLLIFMAIPFSFLGVFAGLFFTDNAIGFFTMVGFLGLIGIAVNNTILLTDYANQELEEGENLVDAVANATKKRFRPLITTSLTTVAALLPLALTDPFWEALAFTIIFGLLSSTFLVVISFPYYYLFTQKLKQKVAMKIKSFKKA